MITRDHGDNAGDVSGYAVMRLLLQLDPRPDGVFCHNDPTAMGAMNAILDGRAFAEAVTVGYHDDVRSLWQNFIKSSSDRK